MGGGKKLLGALITGGLGYCAYQGYSHWQSIQIFPPQTRQELREALRADLDGRSGDAERSFHEALTSSSRLTGPTSNSTRSILIRIAEFYVKRNRHDRAANIYENVLTGLDNVSSRAGQNESSSLMEEKLHVWKAFADACLDSNQVDRAAYGYDKILELAIKSSSAGGLDYSTLGPIYEGIGNLRFRQNDVDKAVEAYQRAAQHASKDAGPKSIEHLTMLNNVASCHFARQTPESLEKAKHAASEALAIAKALKEQPEVHNIMRNLENILKEP